jgi:hypothetical protein
LVCHAAEISMTERDFACTWSGSRWNPKNRELVFPIPSRFTPLHTLEDRLSRISVANGLPTSLTGLTSSARNPIERFAHSMPPWTRRPIWTLLIPLSQRSWLQTSYQALIAARHNDWRLPTSQFPSPRIQANPCRSFLWFDIMQLTRPSKK